MSTTATIDNWTATSDISLVLDKLNQTEKIVYWVAYQSYAHGYCIICQAKESKPHKAGCTMRPLQDAVGKYEIQATEQPQEVQP